MVAGKNYEWTVTFRTVSCTERFDAVCFREEGKFVKGPRRFFNIFPFSYTKFTHDINEFFLTGSIAKLTIKSIFQWFKMISKGQV